MSIAQITALIIAIAGLITAVGTLLSHLQLRKTVAVAAAQAKAAVKMAGSGQGT